MIYIVHGEDTSKSRKLIINQQKKLNVEKNQEHSILDVSPEKLNELINSIDLFGEYPFLILNITNTGRSNFEKQVEILEKTPDKTTVIIYSEKALPKTNIFIKNADSLKAKVIDNPLIPEGNVFRFVDAVFSKRRTFAYKELQSLLEEKHDSFELFAQLQYGLRTTMSAKLNTSAHQEAKSFIKAKAENQAKLFTLETLKELYDYYYSLDKKVKIGEISPEMMLTMAVEKVINS